MELTITRADLAAALKLAGTITYKGAIPIYGYVLLRAENNTLVVGRTNSTISVVSTITCDVFAAGALAVPHKLLADVLAGLRDDRITLRAEGASLVVIGSAGKAKVKGLDPAEYPMVTADVFEHACTLPAATLATGIKRTKHAAAIDTTRPNLATLLVRLRGGYLTMVGCDSFRLARYIAPLPEPVEFPDLLVPLDVMALANAAFSDSQDAVTISANDAYSQVTFSDSRTRITATLVNGQYVEFQRVIDQGSGHDIFATVDTSALLSATRFSQLISREALHTLKLTAGAQGITLHARANQVGEDDISVPAETGAEGHIYLDNVYLTEALASTPEKRVQLSFKQSQTIPIAIRPVGEAVGETIQVIMPMQVKEPVNA